MMTIMNIPFRSFISREQLLPDLVRVFSEAIIELGVNEKPIWMRTQVWLCENLWILWCHKINRSSKGFSSPLTCLYHYLFHSLSNLFTMPTALGINGFGRIGRLVMRAALDNPDATVVAVNDPFLTLEYAAYQFKHDSVHGLYPAEVTVADGCMVIGDVKVQFFSERNPEGMSLKSKDTQAGYSIDSQS